jgi:hypothetical protein
MVDGEKKWLNEMDNKWIMNGSNRKIEWIGFDIGMSIIIEKNE